MKEIFNNRGEGYINTGVKIIIAVVIGALILGGLYLLQHQCVYIRYICKPRAAENYRHCINLVKIIVAGINNLPKLGRSTCGKEINWVGNR